MFYLILPRRVLELNWVHKTAVEKRFYSTRTTTLKVHTRFILSSAVITTAENTTEALSAGFWRFVTPTDKDLIDKIDCRWFLDFKSDSESFQIFLIIFLLIRAQSCIKAYLSLFESYCTAEFFIHKVSEYALTGEKSIKTL